jgi:hypothetical protein
MASARKMNRGSKVTRHSHYEVSTDTLVRRVKYKPVDGKWCLKWAVLDSDHNFVRLAEGAVEKR